MARRRLRRLETWPLRHVPKTVLVQPFAVFLGILCVVAGLPLAATGRASSSVEAVLPTYVIHVWGVMLGGGGVLLTYGLLKPDDTVSRAGLSLLGPAALAYSLIVLAYAGVNGLFSAAITLAFALACFIRGYVLRMGARFDALMTMIQARADADAVSE